MKPSGSGVKHSTSLVDLLATLNWGGHTYPAYSGKCEDVGGAAAGAGAGAGDGAGAASSTAGSGATGASPASGAASSASPAGAAAPATEGGTGDGTVDWKTAPEHFRKAYETLKGQASKFDAFKDVEPESLTAAHQFHQTLYTESMQLADELGYEDAETVAAFHKDPVKLLNFLRTKKAEADAGGPATEGEGKGEGAAQDIEKLLNQRLKPFEQMRAKQMADSANNLFRTTVADLIAADYKGEDALPPELQNVLSNMVSDRLKSNPQAIHRLVNEAKTSDLQKMYSEAKTALLDIFAKMSAYDKARVERATKAAGSKGGKPPAGVDGQRKSSTGDEPATRTGGRGRTKFDEVAERLITQPEKVNSRYAPK